jgi:uncharacterized membrane protein
MPTTVTKSTHTNGRTLALQSTGPFKNVGEWERLASLLGGGALAIFGLTRGSLGGLALATLGAGLVYRGASGHCPCYTALGLSTADRHGPATSVASGSGVKVEKSITIHRPAEHLYRYWRNLENLPRFMEHIQSVTTQGNRSHWVVRGPLGTSMAWDAQIINERPNELIAWRSLPGSTVDSAGSVHFQAMGPGAGTRVTVSLKYDPPAGKLGVALAQMLGQNPAKAIEEDLGRFKKMMEAGEGPMNRMDSGSSWDAL